MAHGLKAPGFGGTLSPHLLRTTCTAPLRHPINPPCVTPVPGGPMGLGVWWGAMAPSQPPWGQGSFPAMHCGHPRGLAPPGQGLVAVTSLSAHPALRK